MQIVDHISLEWMQQIGSAARVSARTLAHASDAQRSNAIRAMALHIKQQAATILAANTADMIAARRQSLSPAALDRLLLTEERIEAMQQALLDIAELSDPLERILEEWDRPNGLLIQRVSVPLGVIGVIFEARPNVTADAAALCVKSGNAVILRAGSDCLRSAMAISQCLQRALVSVGLSAECVQLIPSTDRNAVTLLLGSMRPYIDVIIPRGGKHLVEKVQLEARVPVIGHLEGNCHVYIDSDAQADMALAIVVNSKLRRTGVCGACETVLIHESLRLTLAPKLIKALLDHGCEVRADQTIQAMDNRVIAVTEEDYYCEFLGPIIAAKMCANVHEAVAHINHYGSHHTDAIVTDHPHHAQYFLHNVDSAIVLHNASTQFADGGEFGFGGEIGISTDRLHARGPVGVQQLTSYQYRVRGDGQVRAR